MKHPVYEDAVINQVRTMFIENVRSSGYEKAKEAMVDRICRSGDKSVANSSREEVSVLVEGQLTGFLVDMEIIKFGHVLINVDREEWDSTQSKKTLSMIDINQFNFPFRAATIVMGDKTVNFALGLDSDYAALNITHSDPSGVYLVTIKGGRNIGHTIDAYDFSESNAKIVYDVLSVLLFVATFHGTKQVKSCVSPKTSGSKRKLIPRHTINTIKLQPTVSTGNTRNSSSGSKSDMTWIVRGFWRSQSYVDENKQRYNKPKWIAHHWRGAGKEQVEKVYKI